MKLFTAILVFIVILPFYGHSQRIDGNKIDTSESLLIATYAFVNKGKPRSSYRTIKLKSDSTVVTTFSADIGIDILTGNWHLSNDTVKIKLNPKYGNDKKPYFFHWQENMMFKITKNKLVPIITFQDEIDKKAKRKVNRKLSKAAFIKIKDRDS
jgi:hypothetical protein